MIMVSFTNSRVIHRRSMKPLLQIENSFDTQTYCCTANVIPILVPLKYVCFCLVCCIRCPVAAIQGIVSHVPVNVSKHGGKYGFAMYF